MKRLALLMGLCLLHPYALRAAPLDSGRSAFYYLSPVPNAQLVSPHANLIFRPTAKFREEMPGWMSRVEVTGRSSGIHTGRWVSAADGRTFIFEPQTSFQPGELVAVRVRTGGDGAVGPGDVAYTFTVSSGTAAYRRQEIDDLSAAGAVPMSRVTTAEQGPVAPTADYDLPDDFPHLDVTKLDNPSAGNVFVAAFSPPANKATYLMILDNTGTPLFFRGKTNDMFVDFKKLPDGRLSYFDYELNKFYFLDKSYSVVDSAYCQGYITDLHDVRLLPDGHILIMGYDPETVDMSQIVEGGDPEAEVDGLIIQEQDADRNVVFQWRSWDHVNITDADHVDLTAHRVDYVHANSIMLDNDGNIIVSCRHLTAVLKINRDTGDVMWWLGGKHNAFTLLGDNHWFSHQHSCRRLPSGNITLFDNGRFNDPRVSRALEYRMDEENKTVTRVWSFTHDPALFGAAMGDVQRLPDGSTMIGWGSINPDVTEVRPDGSTTFEMKFPAGTFTYRAFRFEWDGAAKAPFLWSTTGDNELRLDFTWFGVDGVAGYDIYRSDTGGSFALAGHSDGNRFVVHGFTAGETLRFKVKAVMRGDVESSFSNTIAVTPTFDDEVIVASLDLLPRTLNLESMGRWVEARITLPDACGCAPADVDLSSIRLNGVVPPTPGGRAVTMDGSGVMLSLKFDRAAVIDALGGKGDITVTGMVGSHGFAGYGRIALVNSGSTGANFASRGNQPPATDALLGSVPNPFNPTTRIRYALAKDGVADIRVFDVAGRLVRTLVQARQPAGVHSVVWDGHDDHGRAVASGVYFCRMRTADHAQTLKIVMAK